MTRQFVVIDENGEVSWSDKPEGAESFKTFDAAEKRAKDLAKTSPGETIGVYGLLASVTVPVGAPVTRRKTIGR